MRRIDVIDRHLEFAYGLETRSATNFLVIHHTGSGADNNRDFSAEQIHGWHLNNGWAGIGYHYVVRKDGTVEQGRPHWTVGSHACGKNWESIGIHLSGDFTVEKPTDKQIENTALLIANICTDYGLPIDRQHVFGHREVGETSCPGDVLFGMLDEIVGKAIWHSQRNDNNEPAAEEKKWQEDLAAIQQEINVPESDTEDIERIATLARKYESNGDPAAVSSGTGDLGGISYGLYQLSSNVGTVKSFLDWLCAYPDPKYANYGKVLSEYEINSQDFIDEWKSIGGIDPGGFGRLQDEYIKQMYYDKAVELLEREDYHADKHTDAMKAVILSRAVQNGPTGTKNLFVEACGKLGHPNLSYIDDSYFDYNLISTIYNFLIAECDTAHDDGTGIYRSIFGFCNGSLSVIKGLRNRFVSERNDALAMLGE